MNLKDHPRFPGPGLWIASGGCSISTTRAGAAVTTSRRRTGKSEPPSQEQPRHHRATPGAATSLAKAPNQGPPDLDELWRDFNRKLGGLFGGAGGKGRDEGGGGFGGGGNFQPDMKSAGIGAGLIAAVVMLIWLGTGFFIVQEGQQAVITQFGKLQVDCGCRLQLAFAVSDPAPRAACSSRRSVPWTSGATPSSRPPACANRPC
jgi:hypothetical protein